MNRINEQDCLSILLKQNNNMDNLSVEQFNLAPLSQNLLGFLGYHLQLEIKVKGLAEKRVDTVKLFVKTLPELQEHVSYIEEMGLFRKEYLFFQHILPKLQEASAYVRTIWSPPCYLEKSDILVFENMAFRGYRMYKSRRLLDFNHVCRAAEALARFHSSSIIWEDKENKRVSLLGTNDTSNLGDLFPECLQEVGYARSEGHPRLKWFTRGIEMIHLIASLSHKYDERDLSIIRGNIRNVCDDIVKRLLIPSTCKSVVSHGDLWTNNLMFSYDTNGSPDNCILVDFQMVRYAPCERDLACFIYLNTDIKFREKYLRRILSVYYSSMLSALKAAGVNHKKGIEDYDKFMREFSRFEPAAVLETCLFWIMTLLPNAVTSKALDSADTCMDMLTGDKTSIIKATFSSDHIYKELLTEIITLFIDDYVLRK